MAGILDYHHYEEHMSLIEECPNLACSKIDKSIYEAFCNAGKPLYKLKSYKQIKHSLLAVDNYQKGFENLLIAEFAYSEMCLRRWDGPLAINLGLKEEKKMNYVEVPNVSNGEPNLVFSDKIVLNDKQTGHCRIGTIRDIDKDLVWFDLSPTKRASSSSLAPVGEYLVRFASSGNWLEHGKRTLKDFNKNSKLMRALLDGKQNKAFENKSKLVVSLNDKLCGNERQVSAIKNILEAKCRPHPYILMGPPGTGKTFTIIQAVCLIYESNSTCRILVTASANTCVDKLANDLKRTKRIDSFIRLSSIPNLKKFQSLPEYYTSDKEMIAQNRVIVTTNRMALFISFHFDYVFVDEAGHASEPEALMALNRCAPDGCIVLAGDDKQLGPVIKCRQAANLGLDLSLLERLRTGSKLYKMISKPSENNFNERYATKLLESYRCDPRVFAVCNEMFYQNALTCHGKTPPALLKILKCKQPTWFIDVPDGKAEHYKNSFSLYNEFEAQVCVDQIIRLYKIGFEPYQIGVITPYKLQKKEILDLLRERLLVESVKLTQTFKMSTKYKKCLKKIQVTQDRMNKYTRKNNIDWMCKVDTVDAFQGDEREVIIVSLVRTLNESTPNQEAPSLRFIDDKKRFNVTLTRAMWLNIVIGHKNLLVYSNKWARYIKSSEHYETRRVADKITYVARIR